MSRTLLVALICSSCLLQLALQAPLNYDSSSNLQESTYPSLVDSHGNHLSYDLTSHLRHKRSTGDHYTYFKIDAFDHSIILNVTLVADFLTTGEDGVAPVVQYMHSNGTTTTQSASGYTDCHHGGHVQVMRHLQTGAEVAIDDTDQWASISSCQGLRGIIATKSGYIFIEPVRSSDMIDPDAPRQHTVYKTASTDTGEIGRCTAQGTTKQPTNKDSPSVNKPPPLNRLKRRGVVSEITIETAVVADKGMLEEHGRENLESYLFTLMGVVHHLYKDSSIGHSVTLSLVRVIILEDEPEQFSSTNMGYRILNDFCGWQKSVRESMSGPHFDVAVLVTRKGICESSSHKCGTLGLADISSVCDPERSCNINKDTGLSTAFTIAHELGHNLGLRHDGDPQVRCSNDPRYLMAPTFAESLNPHMWSACSREQLTNQLSDKSSVSCLLNTPGSVLNQFSGSPILFGMEYTATEQCRLQTGDNHTEHCPGMTDECRFLWCRSSEGSECTHQHSPPAPGTACNLTSGGEGVCHQGACQEYSKVIEPRDGGWGQWAEWSACSLTCGMGVQYSDRKCDSPVPANGGQWCSGSRRRYRVCQTQNCSTEVNFRDTMCQRNPPNTQYSPWESASLALIDHRRLSMCKSHCVTESRGDLIYSVMYDLPDGAPCLTAHSKGVCVQGTCEPVGCDGVLGGHSYMDECGVWCGRGDTCVRVSGVFNDISLHGNYYYYHAGCIPAGSANITVEEITPNPNNYIIIDGEKSKIERFNSHVRQNGLSTFFLADSSWTYSRSLTDSTEYFSAEGPVNERILLYVLANSKYPGIRYSFSMSRSKVGEVCTPVHYWRVEEWGVCEGVCGQSQRTRAVNCVKLAANKSEEVVVDSPLCDPSSKPETKEGCSTGQCAYVWSIGSWSECDGTCGHGYQTRAVSCELTMGNGDKLLVNDTLCEDVSSKPASVKSCTVECVYRWEVSSWSDCDVTCGSGRQSRSVECVGVWTNGSTQAVEDVFCADLPKPEETRTCSLVECVYRWSVTALGSCTGLCGEGEQQTQVNCEWVKTPTHSEMVPDTHCDSTTRPPPSQKCHLDDCQYEWITKEWSACDAECGEGWKTREVLCLWEDLQSSGQYSTESEMFVSDDMCSPDSKPDSQTSCVASTSCATTPPCTDLWSYCSQINVGFCASEPFKSLCCKCS